jgi:hypothetical protein
VRLEASCEKVFARHETFHPRYGWVKKAYDAATSDPGTFLRDDAVVELGVGKNMVKSIRHWGTAFGVIANEFVPSSRVPQAASTSFGELVFADDGWDPYCELPGTQWLLHWRLIAPGSVSPVWWLAFNEFAAVEFTPEELEQFIADRCRDWADPHPTAVRKDVSCFIRMYSSGESVRATFDDLIDCPFRELNLVRPSPSAPGAFRFEIGAKPTLPAAVAAYASLDFLARTESSARVVSVSRLATEHGAPGRVFKLPEGELVTLLEEVVATTDELELTTSAGAVQIALDGEPAEIAGVVLRGHYRRWRGDDAKLAVPTRSAAGVESIQPHAGAASDRSLELEGVPQ